MKLQLAANLYLLICCGFGLFYGIARINTKKKTPTYLYFSLFAVAGAFLSRVFYVLSIAFYGGLPKVFNIGFIGFAAMFLFFLLANIGQIDWLIDDRIAVSPVYRVIPAVIPSAELAFSIFGFFLDYASVSVRISYLVISVAAGFAGYFHIKHILIPDVDFGFAKAIRGYNLIALFIGLLSLAEIGLSVYGFSSLILYVQIPLGVLLAAVIPVLGQEVQKWTR